MISHTVRYLALTITLTLSLAVAASAQVDSPNQVVEQIASSMSEALNTRQSEFEANPELLEELVRRDLLPALDVDYSARLILGRAGRGATPEQFDKFSRAMSELLISRYASGLMEFRDREQVEVMPNRGELNEKMTRAGASLPR